MTQEAGENSRAEKVSSLVREMWEKIFAQLDQGIEVNTGVLEVERQLAAVREHLRSTPDNFSESDWVDLQTAENIHNFYKVDILPSRRQMRSNEIEVFRRFSESHNSLWSGLSQFGIKTTLLAHGGLGLASLAAYAQIDNDSVKIILAIFLLSATVGAIVSAIGIIITLNYYSDVAYEYSKAGVYTRDSYHLNDIRDNVDKIYKNHIWGDRLIYTSVAILGIECVFFSVALILLSY